MNRYSITVLGKSEDKIDYKFCVGINVISDDIARMAADNMKQRMAQTFVGNWWIEWIRNELTGKLVLLRDE